MESTTAQQRRKGSESETPETKLCVHLFTDAVNPAIGEVVRADPTAGRTVNLRQFDRLPLIK